MITPNLIPDSWNIHISGNVLQKLLNPNMKEELDYLVEQAEKKGERKFTYFSDIQLIYYFVHEGKNMSEEKNRKENTKAIYLKEILMFCQQLVTHAEELEINIEDIQTNESLLKTLAPWNMRRYNKLLKNAPNGRKGKTYAAATLAKKTTIIRSFLHFLYRNGYIERPIHEDVKRESVREEDRPNRDMSQHEVSALLNHYKEQGHLINYTLILFLATTGLRIKEICDANMSDMYELNGDIWLKVVGKRDSYRDVYISETLYAAIKAFRYRRELSTEFFSEEDSPLLATQRGKRYNSNQLSNQITAMIKETGLSFVAQRENPITAHTFRHAFAIMALDNGADVYNIQKTLGHKSFETTSKVYLEKHQKRINNAALTFAKDLS